MSEYGRWSSSQWNKEGLCLSMIVEEKEDVNKLNLFFKLSNLELIQKKNLHKKWLRKLGATCHKNSENKIIKQNKKVFPRYLKQINSKIFKQTSF